MATTPVHRKGKRTIATSKNSGLRKPTKRRNSKKKK